MFDLHRHDEYSTFDGYGKATELAALAKELGYKSLCTTNHGNTNGLIQTYEACKVEGIKPILGVEGYILPKYKEKTRGYHLILIAKNLKGYGNLNRIQFEGDKQKYYNPIWDLSLLKKYHEGLICTTACIASYSSQAILKGHPERAEKFIVELEKIFGDDLYVEIQPYPISDPGVQEEVNLSLIEMSKHHGWKMILTSDSHRGRRDDMSTYCKMHEIAGHNMDHIVDTYSERYMPAPDEMFMRFVKMHGKDLKPGNAKRLAKEMYSNLDEIEAKCEDDYLKDLPLVLPKIDDGKTDSWKLLLANVKQGLKDRGKYRKEYIDRCKEELEVIKYHHFEDYFLIVADYTNWAKDHGIQVGPGRGSVCNCLVAYALKITEVDSLFFGLDFRRFLRKDKKNFPDVDLDFETSRRHEVIEYLCKKYEGHAARICSYGLYKVDNLLNDLAKVCGLQVEVLNDKGEYDLKMDKKTLAEIKKFVNRYINGATAVLDSEGMLNSPQGIQYNKKYDNILVHFSKLYKKVRFIGTHAAGVAITGGNILDYTALKVDSKGDVYTSYDLEDIESINVIKFDILGLKTMESIGDLRKETGITVDYTEIVNDEKMLTNFREGRTDGVFQFEKPTARNILSQINCDSFNDVVAASAMNRPGPLSTGQPEMYAMNKYNRDEAEKLYYYNETSESYGTIIYQEQVQRICVNLAGMDWQDADKVMKMMKGSHMTESAQRLYNEMRDELFKKFIEGSVKNGFDKDASTDLFEKMTTYTFNKGHSVGYSLISMEEMFYKTYFPNEYWFSKLKYARDDSEMGRFQSFAVADGSIIFLPHVNWSDPKTKLRKMEGEKVIQLGLSTIKNVGEKACVQIKEERDKNGVFRSYDDFYDRCKSRLVTSRVIDALTEAGALQFNKSIYISGVTKYNSSLMARS
ncbi:MAG: DNA polymerase III alpha NTPase domain protein [Bacteriophage sp.]|nr:MAG: DNA polymerase III alpha NTPase domain protein [Bacteriophage sp.]